MFRLEKEQRTATPEEASTLAAYSGFGGIKAVLSPFGKLTDILRWTQADRELFPLVTELHNVLRDGAADEREYKRLVESVKASTFTAFYTPPAIINAIASSLGEHGVSPGRFLDPSSGTGNFVSAFQPQFHSAAGNAPEIVAYEKDLLTGRILARLHPEDFGALRREVALVIDLVTVVEELFAAQEKGEREIAEFRDHHPKNERILLVNTFMGAAEQAGDIDVSAV